MAGHPVGVYLYCMYEVRNNDTAQCQQKFFASVSKSNKLRDGPKSYFNQSTPKFESGGCVSMDDANSS